MTTPPELTDGGRSLLFRAIAGEEIAFTRFKAGNGSAPADNDLGNVILDFPITATSVPEEGYISLTGAFDSDDVDAAFRWKELGVFCEDEDGDEYLYAYVNEGDSAALITPTGAGSLTEQQVTVIVAIGAAENVTVRVSPSALYASKDDFDAHVAAANPHGTDKAAVGLGNVENYAVNAMPPTYTEAGSLSPLTSGETLAAAFGKLKKAVGSLISHLADTANPHRVTAVQAGAAAAEHTHPASDIASGVLSVARGGTGSGTAATARASLGTIGYYSGGYYNGGGSSLTLHFPARVKVLIIYRQYFSTRMANNGLLIWSESDSGGSTRTYNLQTDWSVSQASGASGAITTLVWSADYKSVTITGHMNSSSERYVYFAVTE